MDLRAANEQNAKADRLTRIGMMVCFLVTGAILLATLAVAGPASRMADRPALSSSFPK